MSADIVDMIKKKRTSKLVVSVSVPDDDVLEESNPSLVTYPEVVRDMDNLESCISE